VVVSGGVHPEYVQVLTTETHGSARRRGSAERRRRHTDVVALRAAVDATTAAVVISQPSFFAPSKTWRIAA